MSFILGTPEQSIYEDKDLFFDNFYHLNQTGMTLRTESLITQINNSEIIKQIEPTLQITKNDNQKYATTSQSPLPIEGYQFEISLIKADTVVNIDEPLDVEFSIKNSSPIVWPANGLVSENNKYLIVPSFFVTSNDEIMIEGRFSQLFVDMSPGETRTFKGEIPPLYNEGSYTITISMVQEQVAWFNNINIQNNPLSFEVTAK